MMNKRWYALAVSGIIFVGATPYIFPEKERSGIEKELEKMEIKRDKEDLWLIKEWVNWREAKSGVEPKHHPDGVIAGYHQALSDIKQKFGV